MTYNIQGLKSIKFPGYLSIDDWDFPKKFEEKKNHQPKIWLQKGNIENNTLLFPKFRYKSTKVGGKFDVFPKFMDETF